MSRISNKEIALQGVTVEVNNGIVTYKGKVSLSREVVDTTEIQVEGEVARVLSV